MATLRLYVTWGEMSKGGYGSVNNPIAAVAVLVVLALPDQLGRQLGEQVRIIRAVENGWHTGLSCFRGYKKHRRPREGRGEFKILHLSLLMLN